VVSIPSKEKDIAMMDIVTIDFETYYDQKFSLSKMTTEAYIRDPQFEIIGVGIKVNDYPTDWYAGDNVGKFLKSLDYSKRAILCHNTAFDGAILAWHFGINPRLWLDTLSMARPLHNLTVGGSLAALTTHYGLGKKGDEVVQALGKHKADFTAEELAKYGEYCINDVELTHALFNKLKVGFPSSELLVIDQTLRMYTEPVIELDVPLLEKHLEEVRTRKRMLLTDLGLTGVSEEALTKMLMSNEIFAKYLKNLGIDPPTKISARTGKEAWAFAKTDKGMTDLLEHPDERVQAVVTARLGTKSTIEETRTESLIGVAGRGRLPIMLNYYGAHTGRFSGGDKLNLQNLPSRGNTTIRRALKAPEGQLLVSCDSSQIEARTVAWVAGQDDLVQAFRDKRDVYSEFATEVYGRAITKDDKIERFVGKTCILGLGYGMGAEKLRRTLEIGQAGMSVAMELYEAERIVRIYRAKNFKIVQLWQKMGNMLSHMVNGLNGSICDAVSYSNQGILLPNKLLIKYPALRQNGSGFEYIGDARTYRKAVRDRVTTGATDDITWTKIYGGKATENLVQALAAIVIREQMAKIGQHYHVAFQVHDEIIISTPDGKITQAEQQLVAVMSTPPKWAQDLPIACESGHAKNYGDT
jgi:DNA polymerase